MSIMEKRNGFMRVMESDILRINLEDQDEAETLNLNQMMTMMTMKIMKKKKKIRSQKVGIDITQ